MPGWKHKLKRHEPIRVDGPCQIRYLGCGWLEIVAEREVKIYYESTPKVRKALTQRPRKG